MPDLTKPLAELEEKWQTHAAEDMDIPTLDYCASELHAVRAQLDEAIAALQATLASRDKVELNWAQRYAKLQAELAALRGPMACGCVKANIDAFAKQVSEQTMHALAEHVRNGITRAAEPNEFDLALEVHDAEVWDRAVLAESEAMLTHPFGTCADARDPVMCRCCDRVAANRAKVNP